MHDYRDLIRLFDECFAISHNTRLIKGEDEPVYLPATQNQPYHALHFAHGFFSSALHECAHWLIAGPERRMLVDFGYWYSPDGRNAEEQALFQQVEVKPQAMEWILSRAAGHPFRVSVDNLNGTEVNTAAFKHAVYTQVMTYCEQGISPRAQTLRNAICHFYQQPVALSRDHFQNQLDLGLPV